ncbi:hypothetical protein [Bradyrhizobium sp. LTSP857]|nr:hypothetical protein [Bradyrhizobium sp. LTSP857]
MMWLVAFVVPVVGVPLFVWAYGRRLDALSGPWISRGATRHD